MGDDVIVEKRGMTMRPTLRYALIYGGLGGAVLAMFIAVVGLLHERVAFVATTTFGYSVMLVAMSFVFVGVKRFRDVESGGVIGFWPALRVGLLIAAVAGLAYVLMWEIYLAITHYRFFDDYIAKLTRDAQASGKSAVEIARMTAKMHDMRTMYANPLIRLPMTFAEIAPIGLVVAIISAAVLRNPRVLPARG
jgi:Protein of unknown function (DUF4199)